MGSTVLSYPLGAQAIKAGTWVSVDFGFSLGSMPNTSLAFTVSADGSLLVNDTGLLTFDWTGPPTTTMRVGARASGTTPGATVILDNIAWKPY